MCHLLSHIFVKKVARVSIEYSGNDHGQLMHTLHLYINMEMEMIRDSGHDSALYKALLGRGQPGIMR